MIILEGKGVKKGENQKDKARHFTKKSERSQAITIPDIGLFV